MALVIRCEEGVLPDEILALADDESAETPIS